MKNDKINIIFIIGTMDGGGVESFIMNYCKNMNKDKFNFVFITSVYSKKIPLKDIESLNSKVYTINLHPKTLKDRIDKIRSLFKIIKEYNNCIVHSNYSSLDNILAILFVRVKIRILHSHVFIVKFNLKEKIKKYIIFPFITSFYSDYFACGKAAGKYMFNKKKFKIINNAIELNIFKFDRQKRYEFYKQIDFLYDGRDGITGDTIVFGHIGRFSLEKNHKFLLEVFKEINNLHDNSYFILIGDGVLFEDIKNKSKELCIDKKILFTGNIDNPYLYYNYFDCLLLPSLNEAFPIVLVEAQANGLQCFVSDVVSKETKILDTIDFLPLNKGSKFWAEFILDKYKQTKFKRYKNSISKLKSAGFDILMEAKKLEEIYITLNGLKNE